MSLNAVQLRNIICKWSSKSMTKPKVQNLWNDLNESYSVNMFHAYSTRTAVKCPGINFCFEFLERSRIFLLSLVKDPIIWEQGKKDSLSRDKQYDLVFFLMYNRFLNYKLFPQNGRYHSSIQVTLQF